MIFTGKKNRRDSVPSPADLFGKRLPRVRERPRMARNNVPSEHRAESTVQTYRATVTALVSR